MMKIFILIILFTICILPITYSIDLNLLLKRNSTNSNDYTRSVFVHRTNSVKSVDLINKKYNKNQSILKFGIETDLSFFENTVVVAHDRYSNDKLPLRDFIKKVPHDIPIFFDIKDTMNNDSAIKMLADLDVSAINKNIIFGSFNTEILDKLNKYNFQNTCFLSWLLVPRVSNYKWIFFEYYARFFGFFGGSIKDPIEVDYLAYNWKTMKKKNTVYSTFSHNRIAGSVDTRQAFDGTIVEDFSFFTDNPEKIYSWLVNEHLVSKKSNK